MAPVDERTELGPRIPPRSRRARRRSPRRRRGGRRSAPPRRRSDPRWRTHPGRPHRRPSSGRRRRRRSAGRCRRSPAGPWHRCRPRPWRSPGRVGPPLSSDSTPAGRAVSNARASSHPVAGVRSLGLCSTTLPVTRAAPSSPQDTATGSFHGVMAATTPRGCGVMKSIAAGSPCRVRPPRAGASSAYCRRVAMPASTPPRASASGLPISAVVAWARSSAASATASAIRVDLVGRGDRGAGHRAAVSRIVHRQLAGLAAGTPHPTDELRDRVHGALHARARPWQTFRPMGPG